MIRPALDVGLDLDTGWLVGVRFEKYHAWCRGFMVYVYALL